jgi:ribonuclease VapC
LAEIAVLDSSAILAFLLNEPGAETVAPILENALLSSVNLCEVHARLMLFGISARHSWNRILNLHCKVCIFSDELARIAAELVQLTKPFGLSLGDRACLALAIERKATVYTTDKIWKKIPLGIEVEVIR